jgi:hypothetical protein
MKRLILLALLTIGCQKIDFRGRPEIYNAFMTSQANDITQIFLSGNCKDLKKKFGIETKVKLYFRECGKARDYLRKFRGRPKIAITEVSYDYARIPEWVITRVALDLTFSGNNLNLSTWFVSGIDWDKKEFDPKKTFPVSLELWEKGKNIYTLHSN